MKASSVIDSQPNVKAREPLQSSQYVLLKGGEIALDLPEDESCTSAGVMLYFSSKVERTSSCRPARPFVVGVGFPLQWD